MEELGARLRALRLEKGLTLRELASLVGKSESYLSKLENGKLNPSLASLKETADALGKPLVHFFADQIMPSDSVLLDGQRRRLIVSTSLEYDILSAPNPEIALFKMTLKKGGTSGAVAYAHPGIESGLVLKGRVKIIVGGKEHILKAGDSITYRSDQPHRFENVDEEEAVGIWAVSPPTF
jgi:transcriptional regulator with XRE-family HTH domain